MRRQTYQMIHACNKKTYNSEIIKEMFGRFMARGMKKKSRKNHSRFPVGLPRKRYSPHPVVRLLFTQTIEQI